MKTREDYLVALTASALRGLYANESRHGDPTGYGNDAAKSATQALHMLAKLNPDLLLAGSK